jgi:ubiquitin carboxyl-terminal hydrolase 14
MKVHIKHAGKTYDIILDPDLPPAVFKESVYQATGVPTDRMKVMVKAGVLKVSLPASCSSFLLNSFLL